MSKELVVTYDEYDEICSLGEDLFEKIHYIPTLALGKKMTSPEAFRNFFSFLVCIIEGNTARSEEEKETIGYINKEISERVAFIEENKIENPDEVIISRRELSSICHTVRELGLPNGFFSKGKVIEKIIRTFPAFSFGIAYSYFINAPSKKKSTKIYASIMNTCMKRYKMDTNYTEIFLSNEEYLEIKKNISEIEMEGDLWIPSENDLEEILVPNIDKTYDFLLWTLELCRKHPESKKAVKTFIHIKNILKDFLSVGSGKTFPWFSV